MSEDIFLRNKIDLPRNRSAQKKATARNLVSDDINDLL
jgi:hypothetical protein